MWYFYRIFTSKEAIIKVYATPSGLKTCSVNTTSKVNIGTAEAQRADEIYVLRFHL